MKIATADTAFDTDSRHDTFSLARLIRGVAANLRAGAAKRALRRELSGMDEALLRDIGVPEDEIWRIRQLQEAGPRAWQ